MLFKEEFCKIMTNKLAELSTKTLTNKKSVQAEICMEIRNTYGFPVGVITDAVTLRYNLIDEPDALLYAIANVINKHSAEYQTYTNIERYFSVKEIKSFSKYKYESVEIDFPFTFESYMVKITDNQFIGKTSAKELMKLRDAQVLNYNANTQRPLILKRGKDFEYYKFDLNRNAVQSISSLMDKNDYIPTVLTLNISPDTDISYNNGKLTINERVPFDILDGFHRYVAMSNRYNLDPEFDYPMELRVLLSSEENARQFIHQEDQHTPLSKAVSESMNKNDIGVKICRRIKDRMGEDIIKPNKGIINETLLSKLINLLYVNKGITYERSDIVTKGNEIVKLLNDTCDEVPTLLDHPWSTNFTIMFFGIAYNNKIKGKELYDAALNKSNQLEKEELINLLTLKRINKLLS